MADGVSMGKMARVIAIVASIAAGAALVAVAVLFGSCSAFGGRCPQEPPPLLDDDVWRFAFAGGALLVGAPVFLIRPSWRRLGLAMVVGAAAGLVIGLMARSAAHG